MVYRASNTPAKKRTPGAKHKRGHNVRSHGGSMGGGDTRQAKDMVNPKAGRNHGYEYGGRGAAGMGNEGAGTPWKGSKGKGKKMHKGGY